MSQAATAKFQSASPFQQALKTRVDAYFTETGKSRRDLPGMYLKTAIILSWFAASWVFLVFFAAGPLGFIAGCASLGLAMAGIGFSVQHDANHGGYSDHKGVNKALAATLDVLGGSSYVWSWKHNIFHHSHPNVVGLDADLDLGLFGRIAPQQPHRAVYRFQFIYLWFLYGMLAVKWHFVDDFVNILIGKVGAQRLPRPTGWKLAQFLAGKALFISWAVVIPIVVRGPGLAIAGHLVTSFLLGLTLATTFQLAHCVEEANFPAKRVAPDRFDDDWAEHQLRTTVDFAPTNKLVTWYVGGLNFQVVHHLFPTVCHLHYPALAKIVADTAKEHGLEYRSHQTVRRALRSHNRWMKTMGQPLASIGG